MCVELFREPKVSQFGKAVARSRKVGEQHIRWFEVAMDDVLLVGGIHGASQYLD
jgi:hypothetical protein